MIPLPAVNRPASTGRTTHAARWCWVKRCAAPLLLALWAHFSASVQAGLEVDLRDRAAAARFYSQVYLASEDAQPDWTGSVEQGDAGRTSARFLEATALRVNWFRAMAGVPGNVTFDPVYNAQAQQAALMLSANGTVSHSPPASWLHYSTAGAEAARNSNLILGAFGPAAVARYVNDPGSANGVVGHRRWLLFPQTKAMGSGDVVQWGPHLAANALWVLDENRTAPRPATRDGFVAWPPPGYVPYQVVYARWSFSHPGASFRDSQVTWLRDGQPIPLKTEAVRDGYGEPTLVWLRQDQAERGDYSPWERPSHDTTNRVTVENVLIGGLARTFSYEVIVFDPAEAPAESPPEYQWKLAADCAASPAVGPNEVVYAACGGNVLAVDAGRGNVLWQSATGHRLTSVAMGSNGTVYAGVGQSPGGVVALAGETGRELWRYPTLGAVRSSPAIGLDGWVFFGTGHYLTNNQLLSEGVLYALDADGRPLWQFTAGGDIPASPAISLSGLLYVGTSQRWENGTATLAGVLHALDARTGQRVWDFHAGGALNGAVALGRDRALHVATSNGRLFCLDGGSGEVLWEFIMDSGARFGSPAVGCDGMVYVGSLGGTLYALNGSTGDLIWAAYGLGELDSTPAVGANGLVYIGSGDGTVWALDASTGSPRWKLDTGGAVTTSSAGFSAAGCLLLGSEGRWARDPAGGLYRTAGHLFSLDARAGTAAPGPWPMAGQNARRTSSHSSSGQPLQLDGRLSATDGIFTLRGSSHPGMILTPQTSLDLLNWVDLGSRTNLGGGFSFDYPLPPATGARFFRAIGGY